MEGGEVEVGDGVEGSEVEVGGSVEGGEVGCGRGDCCGKRKFAVPSKTIEISTAKITAKAILIFNGTIIDSPIGRVNLFASI